MALLGSLFFLTGCNDFKAWFIREFRQDTLADGISRLLIQDLSIIAKEVSQKFDEPGAELIVKKESNLALSEKDSRGNFVKSIYDVFIDYPNEKIVHKDCQGNYATWQGKVHIISATMTAKGYSTNNLVHPVVPDPESIRMHIHVRVENLAINFVGKGGYLFIHEGEFKYTAIPRLATTQNGFMSGMRTTPTADLRLENISLFQVKGKLFSDRVTMPITVEHAHLFAQVGVHDDGSENILSGTLTMFGESRGVPSDNRGLDPDYNAESFRKSYSCHEHLQGEVTFHHVPFEHKLARPVAGLSSLIIGEIANALEHDERCGMASPEVLKNSHFTGKAGEEGEVGNNIISPCSISFENYKTKADCFGRIYHFDGLVTVQSASEKIRGLIVTDQQQYEKSVLLYEKSLKNAMSLQELKKVIEKKPISVIPTSMQSVEVALDVDFKDLKVKSSCSNAGSSGHNYHCQNRENDDVAINVLFLSGQAQATFRPVLAKEMNPVAAGAGFCSANVPVNEGEISLSNLKGEIRQQGNRLPIMADGSFAMVSGKIGSRENQLTGELEIGGHKVYFSDDRQKYSPLIENFDPIVFADSYGSCTRVLLPKHDLDCAPYYGLALNFGRLLVMNGAALLHISSSEGIPGSFASEEAVDGRQIDKNDSRLKMYARFLTPVDLRADKYAAIRSSKDGFGNELVISGIIEELRGQATTVGVRLNPPTIIAGHNINPLAHHWVEAIIAKAFKKKEIFIRPIKPDAMEIHLEARVNNFSSKYFQPNQVGPKDPYLWLESGQFIMDATPFMGLDERSLSDSYPSYSIPTPIVRFDRLQITDAKVIFRGEQGFSLPMHIVKADLKAFSGRYKGEGNYLEGKIYFSPPLTDVSNLKAEDQIVITIEKAPLKPDFDQNIFNESYKNSPYLQRVLPHQ
jgi:hypothetical protein